MKCAKCNGEMQKGSLIEKSNTLGTFGGNVSSEVNWGNLKSSFWSNSVDNKKEVISYRCVSCGYLESYAK